MKNRRSLFSTMFMLSIVGMFYSCEQQPVNPSLILDEVFIPKGYVQDENPSMDNKVRLEELRLENPNDQFYYLKYINGPASSFKEIIFPQRNLLIKSVDSDKEANLKSKRKYHGVIVMKIKGDPGNEIFTIIDQQPQPVGGIKEFYTFVAKNLKYPVEARERQVEGRVFVEFVVDKNGKITKVKAVKGIGAGCDEEAERVLKEAPKWIPGNTGGMDVGVRMILPINYWLSHPQENSGKAAVLEEVILN